MDRILLNETSFTTVSKVDEAQKVDTKKKNVLGTYTCSFMKFEDVNNNNRWYSREIVNKKILNKTVKDKFKNGKGLLMEIDHPQERFTINMDYVAACTTNLWMDEQKNELWGTFDILDTPRGRIAHTLLEYGFNIGVSARAMGKTVERKGRNEVDVDSYMFKTFDLVVEPGFTTSTVDLNESINEALTSLYESYNDEEKEIAKDLIKSLNLTSDSIYSDELNVTDELHESSSVGEDSSLQDTLVVEVLQSHLEKANRRISDLLLQIAEGEEKIFNLENSLNEANTLVKSKETQLNSINENMANLKLEHVNLQEQYETLKDDNKVQENNLTEAMAKIYNLTNDISQVNNKYNKAQDTIKHMSTQIVSLKESLKASEDYTQELETLMEDNNTKKEVLVTKLNETYNELKELKTEEYKPKKKKDLGIQIVSVLNESENNKVDETTFNLLKNLNKKGDK